MPMNLTIHFAPLLRRSSLGIALLLVSNAFGGYSYTLEQTDIRNGKKQPAKSIRMLIDDSNIKMAGLDEENGEMIFDSEKEAMLMVDHQRKSYLQLDKKTIEQLAQKMTEAMAEMEKQLASVPPAQRQMMESMLKGRMPAAPVEQPKVEVKRTGKKDTIGDYKVERVDVLIDGRKANELWLADWSEVKGSEEMAGSFQAMSQLFAKIRATFAQSPMGRMMPNQDRSNWFAHVSELQGFPILSREFDAAGKLVSETTLAGSEETDIPAAEFKAPKGYKKQKMKM